jgi:hypothetical protein
MHASIKLNVRHPSRQQLIVSVFFDPEIPDGRIDYFLPDCTTVHDSIGASVAGECYVRTTSSTGRVPAGGVPCM